MDNTNEIDDKTLDNNSCQVCGRTADVVRVGPPVSFLCQQCHDTDKAERARELAEIKQEMLRLPLPVILADGDGAVYRVLKTAQSNGFLAAIKTIAMSPSGMVFIELRQDLMFWVSKWEISQKIGSSPSYVTRCDSARDVFLSLVRALEHGR